MQRQKRAIDSARRSSSWQRAAAEAADVWIDIESDQAEPESQHTTAEKRAAVAVTIINLVAHDRCVEGQPANSRRRKTSDEGRHRRELYTRTCSLASDDWKVKCIWR